MTWWHDDRMTGRQDGMITGWHDDMMSDAMMIWWHDDLETW